MRLRTLLEMPVDVDVINQATPGWGTFRQTDLDAVASPKHKEKRDLLWKQSLIDVDVYLVNAYHDRALDLRDYDDELLSKAINNTTELTPEKAESIYNIDADPNRLTIILTQNESPDRVGMTPWMLAHRTIHAVFDNNKPGMVEPFTQFLDMYMGSIVRIQQEIGGQLNDSIWQKIAAHFGSSRAMRAGTLTTREEIFTDMAAAALLGKTIRPIRSWNDDLPDAPSKSSSVILLDQLDRFVSDLFNVKLHKAIQSLRGKIYEE